MFNLKKLQSIPFYFLSTLLLLGCIAGEGGREIASCRPGQEFDTISRSCKGAALNLNSVPTGLTKSASIFEDSVNFPLVLSYADIDNDLASGCSITSQSPGLAKTLSVQGLYLVSDRSILDAHNTYISLVSGVALSVSTSTAIINRRDIIVTLGPTTTAFDVVSAINADAQASVWVSAFPLNSLIMTPEPSPLGLTQVPCSCIGGACKAEITTTENFNGPTDFTYRITDKDGTSPPTVVLLNVTSVNDLPVLTLTSNINATELLDSASATTYSADGNLLTDLIVALSDVESTSFTFQLVANGTYGTFTLDAFGNYTYRTFAHQTSDSVQIRVFDDQGGISNILTIPIIVTTINDPPMGTLTSLSDFDEDTSAGVITLTYTDEEGDVANRCSISSVSNVFPDGGCLCNAGVCTVTITSIPDKNGPSSFGYIIYDGVSASMPQEKVVNFTINAVTDVPIVFPTSDTNQSIQGAESDSFVPTPFSFVLDGAVDNDGDTISTYSLLTPPTNGTLTGCLGLGGTGLSCTYTPLDGNLSDSTVLNGSAPSTDLSRVSTDTGTFYASSLGDSYDSFQIDLINIRNTDESINTLFGANAKAYTNGNKITILFQDSLTTGADIEAAIDSEATVRKLIDFSPTGGVQTSTGTLSLANGSATSDSFVLQATDSNGDSSSKTLHISITPTNDRPTICEYSSYDETTLCGLNGCIGNSLPSNIIPDRDDLVFYSSLSGACYKSSGGAWEPVESSISDRTVNELDPIVIDNIKVDEGGGPPEDIESIEVTNIDSSDENVIPLGNIEIYFDNFSTPVGKGDSTFPFALTGNGGNGVSADLSDLRVRLIPQAINPPFDEKVSEIEITVADSTGKVTEVTFTVTVLKVSATHGGWVNFSSTGPKVDALGLVNESRNVCPYSLDLCEGGQSCYGSVSPLNNTSADPDNADAIFMQEAGTSVTCYRMRRNQIQNLAYVGKTANAATISYVEGTGASSDTASVSVSGDAITVTMYDDVTTTDTIVSAIEGDAAANALVKVINLKPTETQDNQGVTTISALSNSSWESFETYCSVTPAALESGCDNGVRSACMDKGSPSGLITPSEIDSRYWDEQADVCYRSTGLTNTDWETYDAPAEVSISWNPFTVNGNSSVSEYRVFRRLSGEEFDFSKPVNRQTISGANTSFSFVDSNKNSVVPPAPATAYYYVVRPVVNGVLTSTSAESGTNPIGVARIFAAPKNMAFAHRWMINKKTCSLMNSTSDITNNYRCPYKGPGDITVSGVQYYDIGKDLLIDRFEAGCAFSTAPACDGTYDNSCIGVSAPNGVVTPSSANLVYYSRSEGKCYYSTGTTINSWTEFNGSSFTNYFNNVEPNTTNLTTDPQFDSNTDKKYHRSSLPPLANIDQTDANSFCQNLEDVRSTELLGIQNNLSHKLPSRKEQIAYSLWDEESFTDSQITSTETGLSLNSSSKCNSSGASGLEDGYVDFDKPDSNDFYSLPGTFASNIRSVITGSNETAACTSTFGVQDAVGNVAEWTTNGLNCPLLSSCFGNENIVYQGMEFVRKRPATDSLIISVLVVNGDGAVSSVAVQSAGSARVIIIDIADFGVNSAENIVSVVNGTAAASALVTARVVGPGGNAILPAGEALFGLEVPGTDDTVLSSSDTSDDYGYWSLDGLRGPCVDSNSDSNCDAELTSWAIEDERFGAGRFLSPLGLPADESSNATYDTDYTLLEIGPTSGITSLKLHDDTVNFNSSSIAADQTGCGGIATGGSYLSGNGSGVWNMEALPCTNTAVGLVTIQDVTFKTNLIAEVNRSVQYVNNDPTVFGVQLVGDVVKIDLFETGTSASQIYAAVITNGALDVFVSGDPAGIQSPFSTPIPLNDMRDIALEKRIDVGFRCMMEIDPSDYDE